MTQLLATALVLPAITLLASAALPRRWAEIQVVAVRRGITSLTGFYAILALLMAVAHTGGWLPKLDVTLGTLSADSPLAVTVLYDGAASLMLALVSFVGWIICRYSIRYLDGDAGQGRYFCWVGFTIGAVSLMVVSGSLLMLVVSWSMTSLGLHHLLLHYRERPAARRAAWTKFLISRLGDTALLGALLLIYAEFQTFHLSGLFAAIADWSGAIPTNVHVAGMLLVLGAVTKSAQFPFHTWLPLTMETPTPVSALMHAGVVNAGGYLIIRVSPFLAVTPWALIVLAAIGAWTACFAAVVMLTQTSVKKSLAYSTIAQMGFMMLQCGRGAYSAAMLHILAHSLYKAHAFLSSGSVMSQRAASDGPVLGTRRASFPAVAAAGLMTGVIFAAAVAACGIDLTVKPGGLVLGGIVWVALTHWVIGVAESGNYRLIVRALAITALLSLMYAASYAVVDKLIASSLPVPSALPVSYGLAMSWLAPTVVVGCFSVLVMLNVGLTRWTDRVWLRGLYVHLTNGFYVEARVRRLLGTRFSA